MTLRLLAGQDVRRALPMSAAIEAVERAFIQYSAGRAPLPRRIALTPGGAASGTTLFMPAFVPGSNAFGAKVISIFPDNIPKGLPTIHALVLLLDPATGVPRGLVEGASLTALRTGAASGVASRWLSRPESSLLAIFGAGVQARAQAEAVCTVRSIKTILVFDTLGERAREFAREVARLGPPVPGDVRAASSPAEAVGEADIICTATTSRRPVFDDRDLRPGVHVNAVGSYQPDVQEVPAETVARAAVVVDSREAALEETGDLIKPIAEGLFSPERIRAELGQVAAGSRPGRLSGDEITLFKSVGLAVQDMAAGLRALEEADRLGLGTTVEV
jgi:ornithine cyclodeaminase/alanine dehydrogenase-like protein (mu-crystallin family)